MPHFNFLSNRILGFIFDAFIRGIACFSNTTFQMWDLECDTDDHFYELLSIRLHWAFIIYTFIIYIYKIGSEFATKSTFPGQYTPSLVSIQKRLLKNRTFYANFFTKSIPSSTHNSSTIQARSHLSQSMQLWVHRKSHFKK